MSTSALCGMGGTASGGVEVTSWSFTQTIDVQDATSFASLGWVERIGCLYGATFTFKSIGTPMNVGFGSLSLTTPTYEISGSVIVDKVTVDTDVNGLITYDHSGKFTGEVTAGTGA